MFRDEQLVADSAPLFTLAHEALEGCSNTRWDDVPIFDDPLY